MGESQQSTDILVLQHLNTPTFQWSSISMFRHSSIVTSLTHSDIPCTEIVFMWSCAVDGTLKCNHERTNKSFFYISIVQHLSHSDTRKVRHPNGLVLRHPSTPTRQCSDMPVLSNLNTLISKLSILRHPSTLTSQYSDTSILWDFNPPSLLWKVRAFICQHFETPVF